MDKNMKENYLFSPKLSHKFSCSVPLKGTLQQFVINGKVQGEDKPFSLYLPQGKEMEDILQLINVRTSEFLRPIYSKKSFSDSKDKEEKLELDLSSEYFFDNNSSARILLCSHTFSLDRFVTNENVSINLKEGASAEFIVMQNEHNKATHNTVFNVNIAEKAKLKMVFISLHGGVISNTLNVYMNGELAECDLSGLYLTDSKQMMTTKIDLNHLKPKCKSNQLFKGLLDDHGVAKFYGRIIVAPDAQKTEAFQANHNLLISNKAKAYTRPQLEIYADDVKCSHGATIGRLNDLELFYMRTRGIPLYEARLLQQMAFAYEVLDKISNEELKSRMQSLVERRMRGEFSNCRNCSKNCC